jgi:nucleotide-binding universal stress UspA family protein
MDDLAAVGCGVILGKILWWGIILVPAILWLHPWILLVAIWIWWVVAKSRAEEARNAAAARAAEAGREGDARPGSPNTPHV